MVPTVKSGSRANNSLWAESPSEITPQTSEFINSADVAIIGGGFSGLWSAFHLKRLEPSLSIAIFEAQELGFGASGRNGGWASSDYPVYRSTLVKRH
ncbi:MAG: FAD-dependent oxidoreductase, partial [Actinobacteria bacterium]|nr:FAD-dependent oxidoreductase [Actinomycetota bacterium]